MKVKNNYLEQLRNLEIVGSSLLPNILFMLNITGGRNQFKLDAWEINEFYIPSEQRTGFEWLNMSDSDLF